MRQFELDHAKGLNVNVYRSGSYDCTNGGASSTSNNFTVVGVVRKRREHFGDRLESFIEPLPRDAQVFSPREDSPAAVLVLSNLRGAAPHLVPLEAYLSGLWTMSGGNLADHSDGRWQRLVASFLPEAKEARIYVTSTVSIHDRIEN